MMVSNATKDEWVKRSGSWFVIKKDVMGKYHVSLCLKKKSSYQMLPAASIYFTVYYHHSGDYDGTQRTMLLFVSRSNTFCGLMMKELSLC